MFMVPYILVMCTVYSIESPTKCAWICMYSLFHYICSTRFGLMFVTPYILVMSIFDWESNKMHMDLYAFFISLSLLYMYRVNVSGSVHLGNMYIRLRVQQNAHWFVRILHFTIFALHVSGAVYTHHQEHKLQSTAVGMRDCYGMWEGG
jgi:hypothetical protein